MLSSDSLISATTLPLGQYTKSFDIQNPEGLCTLHLAIILAFDHFGGIVLVSRPNYGSCSACREDKSIYPGRFYEPFQSHSTPLYCSIYEVL